MSQLTREKVGVEIDAVHRDLARLSVDQLLGTPSALSIADILESHPIPLRPKTLSFLRKAVKGAADRDEAMRTERLLFGCMDLAIEEQTASLGDMLRFYSERGRMIIGSEKVPALEVVPWLQVQPDFDKRAEMQKEMSIFLKGIINPMLLGILELSVRAVTERFGFDNYARYSEAKKQVSFAERAEVCERYLVDTEDTYYRRITPWVEEKIGRRFEDLSRYHALYLMRIRRFDHFFPAASLKENTLQTFQGLGFDLSSRTDVITDISDHVTKNPNAMCIGVNIPGEVYVIMKPVGGLADAETLLHETGHAFFLSHFDPGLPMEYRRLYRSSALDETFAFLFTDLIENRAWLETVAGLPRTEADSLIDLFRTKKLCLIRRYIGKFLAEVELHEKGNIKDSEPYCRNLHRATGFVYEPFGYLIDMEPDFYALDYLNAWAAANVLRTFLETRFGEEWFRREDAGDFLKRIAAAGRRDSVDQVMLEHCGELPHLPQFSDGNVR
ncbi:MAG TPA: hypothetical protein VK463_07575 [Desulfomonilaceae bacterium]|nr:hypothetical protein [Desulfomonilaceae bacterium]